MYTNEFDNLDEIEKIQTAKNHTRSKILSSPIYFKN